MFTPRTILGLSGSLRQGSINTTLLRAAGARLPAHHHFVLADWRAIPVYDGDVEAVGIPEPVLALKAQLAAADALLIATPEYNHSVPGGLKNVIDWLSRPPADRARLFAGKAVGLIGATPGPGGTRFAQTAWLPVFRALGLRPYFGHMLYLGGANKAFDAAGEPADEATAQAIASFMTGFAAHVG